MLLIWFLITTTRTVTVLIAKYLQIKTFAIHFQASGFFTIASHLLNLLNLLQSLAFFLIFIDVCSPEIRQGYLLLRRHQDIVSSHIHVSMMAWIQMFVKVFWLMVMMIIIVIIGRVLYVHFVLTVAFEMVLNRLFIRQKRAFYMIFCNSFFDKIIMKEVSMISHVHNLIFFWEWW